MVLLQTIVLYSGVLAIPHLVWNVVSGGIEGLSEESAGWEEYGISMLGVAAGCLVNIVALLWLSDIFTKVIMLPNELFVKMLERWCFAKESALDEDDKLQAARSKVWPKNAAASQ